MVVIRKWQAGAFSMAAPFYDELLPEAGGFLSRDVPCHALWHYFCVAIRAQELEREGFAYEGDPSPDFNAEAVFKGIAFMHGVSPDSMLQYWPAVDAQARMMGSTIILMPKNRFDRRTSS